MASRFKLTLTDELREFVDFRTGAGGMYLTPSDYVCDLIRRDMEAQGTVANVTGGLEDIKYGRFSDKSILDIADEKDA